MPTKMPRAKYIRKHKLVDNVWQATKEVDRLPHPEAIKKIQSSVGEWRSTTKDVWEGLRK